jgi:hypothetical protein
MRTKTLFVTALLSVACIATAVAQNVYSVNAVGYVNVTLVPGFNLVANPLDGEDNTIPALFANVPGATIVYKFDAASGAFIPNVKNIITGAWGDPDMTLLPGEGAFVKIPGTEEVVVTFVGEVMQSSTHTLSVTLPAGFSIASSQVPQAADLDTLGFPAEKQDIVYKWNGAGYDPFIVNVITGAWTPEVPAVAVAEAFFVKKVAEAEWTRDFSVNDQ